jgi:hypothetical protein
MSHESFDEPFALTKADDPHSEALSDALMATVGLHYLRCLFVDTIGYPPLLKLLTFSTLASMKRL